MNGINYGDNILTSLQKTLDITLKYGEPGKFFPNELLLCMLSEICWISSHPDDANIEKYKEMAKSVCKIEHGYVIGQDIVKEAARQTSVEAFDQVSWHISCAVFLCRMVE